MEGNFITVDPLGHSLIGIGIHSKRRTSSTSWYYCKSELVSEITKKLYLCCLTSLCFILVFCCSSLVS